MFVHKSAHHNGGISNGYISYHIILSLDVCA